LVSYQKSNLEAWGMAKNVTMRIEGKKLIIEVEMGQDFGPSKSGKTRIIASTEGNISAPGDEDVKIGLNVYRYKK
jgi:hypothetical protein